MRSTSKNSIFFRYQVYGQVTNTFLFVWTPKYAWAQPIKTKSGSDTFAAINKILNATTTRKPKNIKSDDGTEFNNSKFQTLMKQYNINHYSTYSVMKASIVERLITTLKNWLWQNFSLEGSNNWTRGGLKNIMERYNNKIHSTIGVLPSSVNKLNFNNIFNSVYNHIKVYSSQAKFKKGDYVRISKYKTVFSKGYTANSSTEIFQIVKSDKPKPHHVHSTRCKK